MPAGDAGLERQALSEQVRERLTAAHLRIDDVLSDRDAAPFHEILDHTQQLIDLIDRLRAKVAAQQAVVDAARGAVNCIDADDPVGFHFSGGGCLDLLDKALRSFDQAQAAQPEGEPR